MDASAARAGRARGGSLEPVVHGGYGALSLDANLDLIHLDDATGSTHPTVVPTGLQLGLDWDDDDDDEPMLPPPTVAKSAKVVRPGIPSVAPVNRVASIDPAPRVAPRPGLAQVVPEPVQWTIAAVLAVALVFLLIS